MEMQIPRSPDEVLSLSSSNSDAPSYDSSSSLKKIDSQLSDEVKRDLEEKALTQLRKPNVPNVNIPERIIICMDCSYDDSNSMFRLGDGSVFTQLNMFKRLLDFYLHSKSAINKQTEFALVILKNRSIHWLQNFTSNVRDIIHKLDALEPEECTVEELDLKVLLDILQQKVTIADHIDTCLNPPAYVTRLLIMYSRSNCLPLLPSDNEYLALLKKHLYFYIDILYTHEEECALYRCEDIYDALQDLDNGYSYVFEVSRNATKIHDCMAKLLAHPLQRPLQKDTNYLFPYPNQITS